MDTDALSGGFQNAPVQSANVFRSIMNAMARPGVIQTIDCTSPPMGLSPAAGTMLLTLCDPETPVYLAGGLDNRIIRDWLTFHTGAPLVGAKDAVFAVGLWNALMPITRFAIGTEQYPDRSTSLIVESSSLSNTGVVLSGPGIQQTVQFALPAVDPFKRNAALFPLGCDFYFTSDTQIAALPRTTQVEEMSCM